MRTLQPRVIPVIQISNGKQVKTIKFKAPEYIGNPVNTAKIFSQMGVHELAVINIDGQLDVKTLKEISKNVFIPLAYGGGVKSLEDAREVLQCGADKIILNTAVTEDLIRNLADEMGSQSIVVSIDHKDKGSTWSYHGTIQIGREPTNQAKETVMWGAGEILLNNIDRDGMMEGMNLRQIREIADAVTVPVTALGGAGTQKDIRESLQSGAHGVAAGSLFCYQNRHTRKVLVNYPPGLSYCRMSRKTNEKRIQNLNL